MRVLFGLIILISIVVVTQRAAFAVYAGESALERIEQSVFDSFHDPVPADWKHPKAPEYIVSPIRSAPTSTLISKAWSPKCWPAAGKSICGVSDSRHRLIALTHYGCCVSNAVMAYSNPNALGLPERDLSGLHTRHGIRIGSTAKQVAGALGPPTITRDRITGRFKYGYMRDTVHAGTTTCGQWTAFVFDRSARVIAIEDTSGC